METPTNNIKVAVVILTFNGKHWLDKFLPTVIEHSKGTDIVVADNGSADGSYEHLLKQYPQVRAIRIEENQGYAEGYNVALRQVEADLYLMINSDIEVTPGWVEPLVKLMQDNPQIAACQPKILAYNQKTHFEYAGAAGGYMDPYGYPFCRGRIFDVIEEDQGQYNDSREVFWATGATLCIRAELYHQAGGLDGFFFAHMEEIDLCWRLKNAGWQIWYCADSLVYHVGGGTLKKTSMAKTYLNFRNNLIMLYKNLPALQIPFIIAFRLMLDHVAAYRALFHWDPQFYFAVAKAHFMFLINFWRWPGMRAKARKFYKGHTPNKVGRFPASIVWTHFIKGKKRFTDLDI